MAVPLIFALTFSRETPSEIPLSWPQGMMIAMVKPALTEASVDWVKSVLASTASFGIEAAILIKPQNLRVL